MTGSDESAGATGRPARDGGDGGDGGERRRAPWMTELPAWLGDLLLKWAEPTVVKAALLGIVSFAGLIFASIGSLWPGVVLVLVVMAALGGMAFAAYSPAPASLPSPPDLGQPIGRDDSVAAVVTGLAAAGSHVSVVGCRGVGTSTCASAAVKRLVGERPEATLRQLYVSIRTGQRAPTRRRVLVTLARLLAIEAAAARRSRDLNEAAADVKAALTATETLLILDNVDDPKLVQLLRPGVTDRYRLLTAGTAASEQASVHIDRLDQHSAVQLLTASAGAALGDAGETVRHEVVLRCGYAPAIIRAAGELIRTNRYTCEGLLAQLRDVAEAPPHMSKAVRLHARHDLSPLAEPNVDVAYAGLDRRARRLFRRLAAAPATDSAAGSGATTKLHSLSVEAICAATRLGERAVRKTLGRLAAAQVLSQPAGDRHSIEPALVTMARIHLLRDETYWSGAHSEARLMKHLAKQAKLHADKRSGDNQEWFRRNHDLLRAAVVTPAFRFGGAARPLPRRVRHWWFGLAVQLCVWYAAEGMAIEWRSTCEAVEATPRRRLQLVPPASLERAWINNELGVVERRYGPGDQKGRDGRIPAASAKLAAAAAALPWWRSIGRAQILTNQGVLQLDVGDVDRALDRLGQAKPLRSRRDPIGQALTDLALGAALYQGTRRETDPATRSLQLSDARRHLVEAANGFEDAGELRGEAAARTNVVLVMGEMGDFGQADAHARRARRCYDALAETTGHDDAAGRAALLLNLGAVLLDTGDEGDIEQARDLLTECRALHGDDRSTGLARALLHLGDAALRSGLPERAKSSWREAREVGIAAGDNECLDAVARRPGR